MSVPYCDIVRHVRHGDREAFGQLVQRYQARLFGLVLMMVRQPAVAEEVTQDAFVRACTLIGTTSAGHSIRGSPPSRFVSRRTG